MDDEKVKVVPLTKWREHRKYPTQGTMRNICARRRENGAEAFLSMVNGRFYVNLQEFDSWLKSQKG